MRSRSPVAKGTGPGAGLSVIPIPSADRWALDRMTDLFFQVAGLARRPPARVRNRRLWRYLFSSVALPALAGANALEAPVGEARTDHTGAADGRE